MKQLSAPFPTAIHGCVYRKFDSTSWDHIVPEPFREYPPGWEPPVDILETEREVLVLVA